MKKDLFVSLVIVYQNGSKQLEKQLFEIGTSLGETVEDYEIIVVDNASEDDTIPLLQKLTGADGIPNLQVFCLTKTVSEDLATWVGVQNCLGDVVIAFDPMRDDFAMVPKMIALSLEGKEVVFARNRTRKEGVAYRFAYAIYRIFFRIVAGIDLVAESPSFRLINKKVVNYLMKFPDPAQQYRFLAATAGFPKQTLSYDFDIKNPKRRTLGASFGRGLALLVSTTRAPMRIVNFCSLFGAVSNLLYSFYVLYIAFTKVDVAPGWVTLSLQQSGMFLLISVVLFVLGEYILQLAKLSSEGPQFHIAQEMTSAIIRHREKLNVTH